MARAFVAGGRSAVVWNRSAAWYEPFESLDASVAGSVLGGVSAVDVIVVCVQDYTVAVTLLDDDDVVAALDGTVIVQLSSGTPNQAREAADWANEHGIGDVDGAIMAFPQRSVPIPPCCSLPVRRARTNE